MLVKRNKMDLADKAKLENAEAEAARMRAMIEYNIMMGNFENPAEEDEEDE